MLCPNCKTELIEVNGRYICSDCGKEVPENEVMTSDWGNSAPATAGIYDSPAAETTPEEGSMPVATFDTSLTESENEPETQTVEQVLQEQTDDAQGAAPANDKVPEAIASESVEAVLQEQADAAEAERPAAVPPMDLDIPAPIEEQNDESSPQPDTGFYTAPAVPVEPIATSENIEVAPVVVPEADPTAEPIVSQPIPEPIQEAPVEPVVQTIPINVSTQAAAESEPAEATPVQPEVVKDMFEDVPAAPVSDPALYADTYGDSSGNDQPSQPTATSVAQLPSDRRTSIIILAIGAVVALLLIGGGTWAYIALNKKADIVINPVIETPSVTWQELQVVDGGFKVNFPGTPEKSTSTQVISGQDSELTNYVLQTDDFAYQVAYAVTTATADKLTDLAKEYATSRSMTIGDIKIGKYYAADAVDFKLTAEGAEYKAKLMLYKGKYILAIAGTNSGGDYDYDTFIKSFKFLTSGSN